MATILLKRGLATDIEKLTLAEGEVAIAYDTEERNSAKIYVGGAGGEKILVTADVAAAVSGALDEAKEYTDTKVDERIKALIDNAPETLDTLKELAEELQKNEGAVTALTNAIANKLDGDSTIDGGTF